MKHGMKMISIAVKTNLNEDMIVNVVIAKIQYVSGNDNDFSLKIVLLLNVT